MRVVEVSVEFRGEVRVGVVIWGVSVEVLCKVKFGVGV